MTEEEAHALRHERDLLRGRCAALAALHYGAPGELAALRLVAEAASDLERMLYKLIDIGETDLVSSDIGAAALCERLNTLHQRLDAAKHLGESS